MSKLDKEQIERMQKLYNGITDNMDDLQFIRWIRDNAKQQQGFNNLKDKL